MAMLTDKLMMLTNSGSVANAGERTPQPPTPNTVPMVEQRMNHPRDDGAMGVLTLVTDRATGMGLFRVGSPAETVLPGAVSVVELPGPPTQDTTEDHNQ